MHVARGHLGIGGILALAALLAPAAVQAQIVWPVNGHTYQLVVDGRSWDDARQAAEAMGGHLATITSASENLWITDTFGSGDLYLCWIGGYQPAGSSEPAGGWRWVTEEPFSYTNWNGGEPNNNGDEWALHFEDTTTADGSTWNDNAGDMSANGYLVEWDNVAVPILKSRGLVALAALIAAAAVIALRTRD